MTNIQLHDLRDTGDVLHVAIVQPVPGMHGQTKLRTKPCRLDDAIEFLLLRIAGNVGIAARMQFDDRRAGRDGSLELVGIGIDEQGNADAGLVVAFAVVENAGD